MQESCKLNQMSSGETLIVSYTPRMNGFPACLISLHTGEVTGIKTAGLVHVVGFIFVH